VAGSSTSVQMCLTGRYVARQLIAVANN